MGKKVKIERFLLEVQSLVVAQFGQKKLEILSIV